MLLLCFMWAFRVDLLSQIPRMLLSLKVRFMELASHILEMEKTSANECKKFVFLGMPGCGMIC